MSWRVMFTAFIATLLASLLAGLFFGYWVLTHSPVSNGDYWQSRRQIPDDRGMSTLPAQQLPGGKVVEPQAGAAVAENATEIAWKIHPEGLLDGHRYSTKARSGVDKKMANSPVGQSPSKNFTGVAGIVSRETIADDKDWQIALRQALQACQSKDAFDRPACLWVARSRYCSAHHVWGKVDDCPARNF